MAAVDSNYTDPSDSFVWWVEGDKLAIATTKGDGGTAETSEGKFKAASIGSSGDVITAGLLISYYSEPDKVTSVSSTIDLDNTLQPALIDFVKGKALMDLAANIEDPNMAQIKMAAGQQSMASYQDAIKRFGAKKRDKQGGTRAIAPFSLK
jgi:hypothetical protein|tara:strand:+ start:266 stop:718 length:453 start_codon:yes stop_codon:yes gene_type:complete